MKTVGELLGQQHFIGARLRFLDWDFNTKYFLISEYDHSSGVFFGNLNCGSFFSVHKDAKFWEFFEDESQGLARAI